MTAKGTTLGGRREQLEGFAFVAPYLFLYLFLLIYPLLRGILLSFRRADPFEDGPFVGFENYARLAVDPVFHQAMVNTFVVTLMIVPVLTVIALALALALNLATRGAAVFRGIFFSSSVLSVTIVTLIWRFVLAPDAGLLGELATALGWEPLPFLSHPDLVLPALAITTIWWSLGLPMMLFLAGLQQIPEDMYEAAALDRANRWTTFWRVTLPSLRRTLILVVMLQTAAQLQLFGQAQL
ncbi:MAG TPA: sugar ABC transporter permease, partial [Sphingomicrobium sp.]|nr:sugar ABC transporter permease [Sphingomicrobium sp.]